MAEVESMKPSVSDLKLSLAFSTCSCLFSPPSTRRFPLGRFLTMALLHPFHSFMFISSPDNTPSSSTGQTRDTSTSNDPQSDGNEPKSGKTPSSSKVKGDKKASQAEKPADETETKKEGSTSCG